MVVEFPGERVQCEDSINSSWLTLSQWIPNEFITISQLFKSVADGICVTLEMRWGGADWSSDAGVAWGGLWRWAEVRCTGCQ